MKTLRTFLCETFLILVVLCLSIDLVCMTYLLVRTLFSQ